jgi:hypothetical protein
MTRPVKKAAAKKTTADLDVFALIERKLSASAQQIITAPRVSARRLALQEYGGWYVASLLANKLTVGDVQAIDELWQEHRKNKVGQAPKD